MQPKYILCRRQSLTPKTADVLVVGWIYLRTSDGDMNLTVNANRKLIHLGD